MAFGLLISKKSGHILEKRTTVPKRKNGLFFYFHGIGPWGGSKLHDIRSEKGFNARMKIEHQVLMTFFLRETAALMKQFWVLFM